MVESALVCWIVLWYVTVDRDSVIWYSLTGFNPSSSFDKLRTSGGQAERVKWGKKDQHFLMGQLILVMG